MVGWEKHISFLHGTIVYAGKTISIELYRTSKAHELYSRIYLHAPIIHHALHQYQALHPF